MLCPSQTYLTNEEGVEKMDSDLLQRAYLKKWVLVRYQSMRPRVTFHKAECNFLIIYVSLPGNAWIEFANEIFCN